VHGGLLPYPIKKPQHATQYKLIPDQNLINLCLANDIIYLVVLNPRRGRWFEKVLNFWEIILKIKIPEEKKAKAIFKLGPS